MRAASPDDTIVAVATAPGRGAIGVLRICGTLCRDIAQEMLGEVPPPRQARYRRFRAGRQTLDQGLALFFEAPHSATGEDMLELHAHGNPLLLDALQEAVCALGARPAAPGEFSERAFRNGKIDLTQAEATADLIASDSRRSALGALRSLQGEFSKRVDALKQEIMRLRVELEAGLDFPDEDIEPRAADALGERIGAVATQLASLIDQAEQGRRLRENLRLALLGAPNSGKSTLLNALSGHDGAIVSDAPGTTRDALRETLIIDGMSFELADTAGLRASDDPVEQEGMRRALALAEQADHLLLVCENAAQEKALTARLEEAGLDATPRSIVRSKIDLVKNAPRGRLCVSAQSGAGMAALKKHIATLGAGEQAEGEFSARRRHLDALRRCLHHARQARERLAARGAAAAELIAEEMRLCQEELADIVGEQSNEELLGEIFSSFCIGK